MQKLSFMIPLLLTLACNANSSKSLVKAEESSALGLGMNDVAILMPLNIRPELKDHLPRLSDTDDKGEGFVPPWFNDYAARPNVSAQDLGEKAKLMMPLALYTKKVKDDKGWETLVTDGPASADYRLVSLRLDPCTNSLQVKDLSECVRELRLVWQVLRDNQATTPPATDTLDANIHTLYTLDQDEFASIVSTLKRLHKEASVDTSASPLLPHPVIEKEGVASPYLKGVLAIASTYARASKLNEIAVMKIGSSQDVWNFMHIAVINGEPQPMAINAAKSFAGDPVFTQSFGETGGAISFTGTSEDTLTHAFTMPGFGFALRGPGKLLNQEELQALFEHKFSSMNAINNPSLHNPKNMDCVSCHIADKQLHQYASAMDRGMLPEESPAVASYQENRFASKWNLESLFPNNAGITTSVQAFSFLAGSMQRPVIIQRVINDAAHTLTFLEEHPEVMLPSSAGKEP